MFNHLKLFFFFIAGTIFPDVFQEEETSKTKKCMYCLRRIKIHHYKCPHCRTANFDFSTNLSEETRWNIDILTEQPLKI